SANLCRCTESHGDFLHKNLSWYIISSERTTPMARSALRRAAVTQNAVVTRAVLRAAGRLGVTNKALGRIIGLSEATISRMGSGSYTLTAGNKAFELAVLFIRLFRALDTIAGGDEAVPN